jgi:hypothetical protein
MMVMKIVIGKCFFFGSSFMASAIEAGLYNTPKGFMVVLNLNRCSNAPILSEKQDQKSAILSEYEMLNSGAGILTMVCKSGITFNY